MDPEAVECGEIGDNTAAHPARTVIVVVPVVDRADDRLALFAGQTQQLVSRIGDKICEQEVTSRQDDIAQHIVSDKLLVIMRSFLLPRERSTVKYPLEPMDVLVEGIHD